MGIEQEILCDGKPCDRCDEKVEIVPHSEMGWAPAPDAGWRLPKRSHGWTLLCNDCYQSYRTTLEQLGEAVRPLSEEGLRQLIARLGKSRATATETGRPLYVVGPSVDISWRDVHQACEIDLAEATEHARAMASAYRRRIYVVEYQSGKIVRTVEP